MRDRKKEAEVWSKYKRMGFDTETVVKKKVRPRGRRYRMRHAGQEKQKSCEKASRGGKLTGGQGGEGKRQGKRQREIQMC